MPQIRENVDVACNWSDMQARGRACLCKNGIETIVFTVSVDSIALMPCNPNIGGSSKGHLVREIDALAERWEKY